MISTLVAITRSLIRSLDVFRHELNLSATETALTVVHHYCPFENDVPKAVRVSQYTVI